MVSTRNGNGHTPTENARMVASMVREEDLEELETLLHEMQSKVDQARGNGQIFMMGQYTRLVALISPEVDRIQRRFKRETLASFRKEHKRLKLEARDAAEEG